MIEAPFPPVLLSYLTQSANKMSVFLICTQACICCFTAVSFFYFQLNRVGGVLKTNHGILLKSLNQSDAGLYHCLATENNFKHTVARVALRILDRDIALALTAKDDDEELKTRQPRPYLQSALTSTPFPPEIRLINQYCQSYWDQVNPKQQQQRKRTSRRHTESQDQGLG